MSSWLEPDDLGASPPEPVLPVVAHAKAVAWPKGENGPPALARYLPLSRVLTEYFTTDAHFGCYSEPSVPHRLKIDALAKLPEGLCLTVLSFDADSPGHVKLDTVPEWVAAERVKIEAVRAAYPGAVAYWSRSGYRLLLRLAEPQIMRAAADAPHWHTYYQRCALYLYREFQIEADHNCKDFTRIFRAPHATRDPKAGPERREIIGDPTTVGFWTHRPGTADLDADITTAEELARAFATATPDSKDKPFDGLIQRLREIKNPGTNRPRQPAPAIAYSGTESDRAKVALAAECSAVATSSPGFRHAAIGAAGCKLGHLVAGGELSYDVAFDSVFVAAETCGEVETYGKASVTATIKSALAKGMQTLPTNPKTGSLRERLQREADTLHNVPELPPDQAERFAEPEPRRSNGQSTADYSDADHDGREPPKPPADGPSWNLVQWSELMLEPLPPVEYACQALDLGPGRPNGCWGPAGAGKTILAQGMALSVAHGVPAFERYPTTQGSVVHISWDVGKRPLQARYRSLANGMLLDERTSAPLTVAALPTWFLNSPNVEAELVALCRGARLVIADCLRDALPGIDENSSELAAYLKILTRVSEATLATIWALHHTKKGEVPENPTEYGRGSSALIAASGSIWLVTGQENEPRRVQHIRTSEAADGWCEPFWLKLERATAPDRFTGPIVPKRLYSPPDAELEREKFFCQVERNQTEQAKRTRFLVELVKNKPGLSGEQIQVALRGKGFGGDKAITKLVKEACDVGQLEQRARDGKGGGHAYHLPERLGQ